MTSWFLHWSDQLSVYQYTLVFHMTEAHGKAPTLTQNSPELVLTISFERVFDNLRADQLIDQA